MVEPYPGTQVIYQHLSTCGEVNKVYPPNTTLIVNVAVDCAKLKLQGSIKKFVVEQNLGKIYFEDYSGASVEEVVIKSTSNELSLDVPMGSLEIQ